MRDLKTEVNAQAVLIARLNENIRQLKSEVSRLENTNNKLEPQAIFYTKLTNAIMDNEALQPEWTNFLIILKMVVPESEYWITD